MRFDYPASALPRRLRRPLSLSVAAVLVFSFAVSASTLAQDTPTTPEEPSVRTTHTVSLKAKVRVRPSGGAFVGTGPVSGRPFGKGRFRSRSTIKSRAPLRTASTFTAVYRRGRVTFKGSGGYVGSTFKATVRVISGTRAYRDITGSNLKVSSVNRGGVETLRVKGRVRYTDPD